MTEYPRATRLENRSDAIWIWIDVDNWLDCANWLKAQQFVRCEWLTAAHLSDDLFQITMCASDELVQQKIVVVSSADKEVASLELIYPGAKFHEREVKQMLGLNFINASDDAQAFNADFGGHPLRRDFALTERTEHEWPGQVDPEKATKRRPALAPGVRQEWL